MASKRATSAKSGPTGATPLTQESSSATHAPSLAALLSVLDLDSGLPTEPQSEPTAAADVFTGRNMGGGRKRIYGGQVLAQAVIAACRTVEPARPLHSLHAYFLRAGVPENPVAYRVERVRDGGSFSTRSVVADQGAGPIFAMMASFHAVGDGLSHGVTMPDAPPPEAVATVPELLARSDVAIPDAMRMFYAREAPMDLRYVDIERFIRAPATAPTLALEGRQRIWLRARTRLPDAPALHQALLAYASDFALVETALLPHGRLIFGGDLQLASLDHGLWFHRPFRVDDWLLYVVDSPVAVGGRGFSRGAFFTADGTIVASVTQELLMRHQSAQREIKN